MAKVQVYPYEGYNIQTDQTISHGKLATMEYIKSRGLTPITKDMLEVSESDLDAEGRYIEKAAKP